MMPDDNRHLMGIATLYEQLLRAVYEDRGPRFLQPAQWTALRFFGRAGPDARTVSGLARFMDVTAGGASRAASALQGRQLIVAKPNPNDRRGSLFDLTTQGQEMLESDPLLQLSNHIGNLPVDEREVFSNVILRMTDEIRSNTKENAL